MHDNPIDYFKMLCFLNQSENGAVQAEIFKTLYHIKSLYIPDTLFKYYSLTKDNELNNKKIEVLENCKVYLSDIGSFNDPFDSKAFYYDPKQLMTIDRLNHVGGRIIDDFSAFILSTSLTANGVQSMPMWAHYSNNHAGFCVSYDMKNNTEMSTCMFPVQYTAERLDITNMVYSIARRISDQINCDEKAGIKATVVNDYRLIYVSILLNNIKHSSWQYENEFRCTIAADSEGAPYISATPKEIYIGMKCNDAHVKRLLAIGTRLNVPVYRMTFEECSPKYKLSCQRLI